ncbi:hypothetical protein NL493_25565 [Klebsiella pneumoniae]|nr:hypothetical protein [Klebsiella pneumoniae]
MAYTLRVTEEEEKILEALKRHTGESSVTKALLYAARRFPDYENRMIYAERDLDTLKQFAALINRLK